MPLQIIFERDGQGVVVRAYGAVTYGHIRKAFEEIWDRPESNNLLYHIIETEPDVELRVAVRHYREIGLLFSEVARRKADVVAAFVVGEGVVRGLIKIWILYGRILSGDMPKHAFCPDAARARAWVQSECPDLAR